MSRALTLAPHVALTSRRQSMLGALEEGGFVPALAILARFAADRERWHKVVSSSVRKDGLEKHMAVAAKHIQVRHAGLRRGLSGGGGSEGRPAA